MNPDRNDFKLGLFVLAATALLVAGTVLLGAGQLFEKRIVIESYFDESVQGLEEGSPVKFQGITIGEVIGIDTVSYLYEDQLSETDLLESGRYVVVTMSITSYEAVGLSAETHESEIRTAVANGLRLRLASIGLTGTKFVEASFFDPERRPDFEVTWIPRYPSVPSAPDAISHIIDNVEDLVDRLADTDLEATFRELHTAIRSSRDAIEALDMGGLTEEYIGLARETRGTAKRLNELLGDPDLDRAPGDVAAFFASARVIAADLEQRLPSILDRVDSASSSLVSGLENLDAQLADPENEQALADARAVASNLRIAAEALPDTVTELRTMLRELNRVLGGSDRKVDAILVDLRTVTTNLRSITQELRANPARVLFGDPPPPGPSER